jgi:hypothetical protein
MAAEQKVQSPARPTDDAERDQGVETDPEQTHATRHRIGQTGVGLPESGEPRPGGDPLGEAADIEPPSGAKSGRR